MAKSIIVYGVKGGKTRFAQRIADYFGVCNIKTLHDGDNLWSENMLYLLADNKAPVHVSGPTYNIRSFQSVADEINATISLTDWQSGPPPMVGEWETRESDGVFRRRWHGDCWSYGWRAGRGYHISNHLSDMRKGAWFSPPWRGLSQEPIKVTE